MKTRSFTYLLETDRTLPTEPSSASPPGVLVVRQGNHLKPGEGLAEGFFRWSAVIACFLLSLAAAPRTSFAGVPYHFELHPQLGHTYIIESVAYSPDGKLIASASDDMTIRFWEVASGKELRSFGDGAKSVAFSPDGLYLASASWDKTVRLWEVSSGKELRSLVHTEQVKAVAFSPDGKYLASAGYDKMVRLWEVSSGKQLRSFSGHTDSVWSVA